MYSKRCVNMITLILSIIIFIIINILFDQISNVNIIRAEDNVTSQFTKDYVSRLTKDILHKKIQQIETQKFNEKTTNEDVVKKWQIEIPIIDLIAPIEEGTDKETLNEFVGHFSITPKIYGNIGLAAHNRGYPVNYFARLKELRGGEEIIYTYGEQQKTYVVTKNLKISDIDWGYLEDTTENRITLITCIENEPAYRRCIQGVEM